MTALSTSPTKKLRADSLFLGMLVLFAATVLQRIFGLARGILFCRYLDEQTLGQWAMALGFLTMVTPLMLWGLPGSMGRFVEHFRRQGRLFRYLRGVFMIAGVSTGLVALAMACCPKQTTDWIFREPLNSDVALSLSVALLGVVVMNCTNDLTSALRQVRTVSLIQFLFSLVFTVVGTGWLWFGGDLAGLIYVYGLSAFTASIPGIYRVIVFRAQLSQADRRADMEPEVSSSANAPMQNIWGRVLPFAASVWMMNLLVNAFEMTDRTLLLYLCPGGVDAGQAAVGQYHSSRILPALLMSLATLVGGVLMPYLSADWEAGMIRRVAYRCKQSLLAVSATFTTIGALTLWCAPWLFNQVMGGKYSDGLAILPATFAMCAWGALAMLAQNYLWCAEKGKALSVSLMFALIVNLSLNAILIPRMGLQGAVMATLFANLTLLCSLWWLLARVGFPLDRTAAWCTLLPGCLLAGPTVAFLAMSLAAIVSSHARRWLMQIFAQVRGNLRLQY